MIGSIDIKVNAARPNLPLAPLFAFQDSPSSLRVMDVPKSIGNWAITSVKVAIEYPDNTTVEKVAVRSGSVWVATLEGSEVAGKVSNGYEVLADGKDEDGNDVTGYVLGKGDVYILENGTELSRLVGKIAVRYMDEIPDVPAKGDLMNSNGELRLFDGEDWVVISTTEPPPVYDSQITIKKNGTPVGTFTVNADQPKAIDIPVPSRTSDIENDSGFITVAAIPSTISSFENDVGYITEAAIPSNVTAFNNDAGYITQEAIPSEISAFENDVGYITAEAIPSQVSSFENDAGYITASALPTKVSELENDSGYITESAIPSNVGAFQNDVGYLTSVSWGEVQDKPDVALMSDIPSNVSELENDSGYITANALPTKVSELQNDVGFITASAIPSNVGAFTNDVGYLTASDVSTSALYPSSPYSAYVQIDDYGDVNAKKLLNETGVWFVKAIMEPYTTNPVTGFWVSNPKITDNGTNLLVEFWVQDKERKYEPEKTTYDAASPSATEMLIAVTYHNVGFRVQLKKSTQADLPVWIDCGRLVRDCDANTGLRISQLEDDIGLVHDISEKRDLTDISYPASVDPTGMYTISKFTVDGVLYDAFGGGYPSTGDSYWTDDGEYHTNCVWTSDGTNYQLRLSDTDFGSTFTFSQLKAGSVVVTSSEVSHTVTATFKQTTFALKDYVDAAIPSNVSELNNDVGYVTASAIPSNVSQLNNDAGYLTAASTTIQNLNNKDLDHETRIREVEKQATGARDWMDLSYPTVNANIQDGFGIAGFTVDFPSYGEQPSTSDYMRFYSVVSGTARWRNVNGTLEMKTGDGTHFSYYNNNSWSDFPLNNTSPTEAWTFYRNAGIRPAYITASFKTSTMKKIALEDYVDAAMPSNTITISGTYADLTPFSYSVYTT